MLTETQTLPILLACSKSNALAYVRGGLHLLGREGQWPSRKGHSEVSVSMSPGVLWVLKNALFEPDQVMVKTSLEQDGGEFKIWKIFITFLLHKTSHFPWPLPALFHLQSWVCACNLRPHASLRVALGPAPSAAVTSCDDAGPIVHPVVIPQSFHHFAPVGHYFE